MNLRTFLFSTMLGVAASGSLAGEAGIPVVVQDAFARAATPTAKAGSVYLVLENTGETERLVVGVTSSAAMRAEFHTHAMQDGVMSMQEMDGPIVIPVGGSFAFERGGDHIMLMGLTMRFVDGVMVPLTLEFADGATLDVEAIVDLNRE